MCEWIGWKNWNIAWQTAFFSFCVCVSVCLCAFMPVVFWVFSYISLIFSLFSSIFWFWCFSSFFFFWAVGFFAGEYLLGKLRFSFW